MATKRSNGEGTAPKYNPVKKRWEVRVVVGKLPNGNLKRQMVTGSTQKAVKEKRDALISQLKEGLKPASADMTVEKWLDYWITEIVAPSKSAGTVTNYRYNAKRINSHIGKIPLTKLDTSDVRRMLSNLEKEGRSDNTRRLDRSTLRAALRAAEEEGLIQRNVAAIVKGGEIEPKYEKKPLNIQEANRLLDAIVGDRSQAAISILTGVGPRKGELLGLTWADLDLDAVDEEGNPSPRAWVRRALKREEREAPEGSTKKDGSKKEYVNVLVLSATKTKKPRFIPLAPYMIEALHEHRERQVKEREAAGPLWVDLPLDHDLIFRTPLGTAVDPSNFYHHVLALTTKAVGRKVTPHVLRHSAATIMYAAGVPPERISKILGHSSIDITLRIYTEMQPSAISSAASKVEGVLGRRSEA